MADDERGANISNENLALALWELIHAQTVVLQVLAESVVKISDAQQSLRASGMPIPELGLGEVISLTREAQRWVRRASDRLCLPDDPQPPSRGLTIVK
jgi:hypothetical protein